MGFFTNYALTIQDRMGTYNSLGTEVDYKPFALLDLKLYYAPAAGIFKRQFPFQAFINITNAMDINYYDRGMWCNLDVGSVQVLSCASAKRLSLDIISTSCCCDVCRGRVRV